MFKLFNSKSVDGVLALNKLIVFLILPELSGVGSQVRLIKMADTEQERHDKMADSKYERHKQNGRRRQNG